MGMEKARRALIKARGNTDASYNVLKELARIAGTPVSVTEDALGRFVRRDLDLHRDNWSLLNTFFYKTELGRMLIDESGVNSPYRLYMRAVREKGTKFTKGVVGTYYVFHCGHLSLNDFVVRAVEILCAEDDTLTYKEYIRESHTIDGWVVDHESDGLILPVGDCLIMVPFNTAGIRPFNTVTLHTFSGPEDYCTSMLGTLFGVLGPRECMPRPVYLAKPNVDPELGRMKTRSGAYRWEQLDIEFKRRFTVLKNHVNETNENHGINALGSLFKVPPE